MAGKIIGDWGGTQKGCERGDKRKRSEGEGEEKVEWNVEGSYVTVLSV